jgi:hypothetical protein
LSWKIIWLENWKWIEIVWEIVSVYARNGLRNCFSLIMYSCIILSQNVHLFLCVFISVPVLAVVVLDQALHLDLLPLKMLFPKNHLLIANNLLQFNSYWTLFDMMLIFLFCCCLHVYSNTVLNTKSGYNVLRMRSSVIAILSTD